MKNYEIKSAMAELSVKEKIKVNSRRIAFLVPEVYRKLKNGFKKAMKQFGKAAVTAGQATIGTVALAGGAVVGGVVAAGSAIGHGAQHLATNIGSAVKEAATDAAQARDEYNANKIADINERIERKEEKISEVKASANLSLDGSMDKDAKTKSYIVKAYESDIEKLRNKTIKVANAPRRLLISAMFIQKLFANRKKRKAERKAAEIAQAEEMLSVIPSIDEVAPVVETATPAMTTPVVETPVVEQPVETRDVDAAIQRYIELNNERENVLESIREDQSVIQAGQRKLTEDEAKLTQCQNEMSKLVSEYGLTQEMVQAKFTR